MFDAIFHPTDLSESSGEAHRVALRLASLSNAELLTVHVGSGEPDWSQWPDLEELVKGWDEGDGDDPTTAVAGARSKRLHIDAGAPLEPLLQWITSFRPDLLVLRTEGRAGLDRLFNGSIAEPLVRQSRVNALVMPPSAKSIFDSAAGTFAVRRVLLPVAPAPDAGRAREAALQLLDHMQVKDAVVEQLYVGDATDAPFGSAPSSDATVWTRQSMPSTDVVAAILHRARAIDADLVVMTSRGHDGPLDALFGSTTEKVLRHAPCPVLVVPARD